MSQLSSRHLDIFPVSVLRLVDVGPELGQRRAGPHQVVRQVRGLDQPQHQVVLHNAREFARVFLQFVHSLKSSGYNLCTIWIQSVRLSKTRLAGRFSMAQFTILTSFIPPSFCRKSLKAKSVGTNRVNCPELEMTFIFLFLDHLVSFFFWSRLIFCFFLVCMNIEKMNKTPTPYMRTSYSDNF